MAIDKKLVLRKINLISQDLKRLRLISVLSYAEYQKKYEYEILSERFLERIIGRTIDINYHLLTEFGYSPPKDYFESFTRLSADLKIFSYKFSKKLAQLAGLRNRLAHEYDDIDEKKVYQAIKELFSDLSKYLKAVEKFINKNNKERNLL